MRYTLYILTCSLFWSFVSQIKGDLHAVTVHCHPRGPNKKISYFTVLCSISIFQSNNLFTHFPKFLGSFCILSLSNPGRCLVTVWVIIATFTLNLVFQSAIQSNKTLDYLKAEQLPYQNLVCKLGFDKSLKANDWLKVSHFFFML